MSRKVEYPTGAIRTYEEFCPHKPGPYYFAHSHKDINEVIKVMLLEDLGIEHERRTFIGTRNNETGRESQWWTPVSGMYFPTGANSCWFVFKNYWYAWAYFQNPNKGPPWIR